MRWYKKGMIFDAEQHNYMFTKSPQALVFDDYVRVYFSTCESDNGKLISRVSFADFDKDFNGLLRVAKDYVIENGKLGCFDEHGIFPFCPIKYRDMIYGYTSGWTRRVSVSADAGIGLSMSNDGGITFRRIGDGPVLSTSLYEPYLVSDGFVRIINGVFHMWYIYGTKWIDNGEANHEPSRVYKIGHAISDDGILWKKEGRQIITDKLNGDECQALPTVVEIDGKYHMYFCYREAVDFRKNRNRSYKIGYAYSKDLVYWRRDDDNAGIKMSQDGWDSEMMCYPNVFKCDKHIYMLYNGNDFGKYGFGIALLEDIK